MMAMPGVLVIEEILREVKKKLSRLRQESY
jgi:hypothetical protein